ncbi:DUF885 domain-containing protein [Massilia sp. Dwa41.01b]|uniref:DUF885 domain-containing protein n=1 Tax=unclassified Massilia TaxID=2609279 RepID=UPI0016011AE8|nr:MULTISPECIES: DUF885 domain-containing protein [unclassified Massilia]QNA90699.1 DUF885 domain-containing protein [Massilia sp. Dwa41.01b]QNA97931.1 DUF885 domain-containing protein [Massilia sp. Se16.2.3]
MNQTFKLGVLAAAALIACAPAGAAQQAAKHAHAPAKAMTVNPQAGKALNKLADEYYDALARFDPVSASESGDNRFIDQVGLSIAPAERTKQFARYKAFQKRLHAIHRDALSPRDQTSYDILDYELATALRFEPFPEHLLPVSQMDSLPVTLANYASGQGAQPLSTPKDYRAYANRLAQLAPWVDQAIANMREGIKRGIVQPKSVMASALPQFKQLAATSPDTSIYYTPVKNFPAGFSDADKRALTKLYSDTIGGKLNPALGRLASFLEKEYLPAARTTSGWNALPDGAEWYKVRVASQTTTDLTPEAIHEIGLKEVARIQGEYGRIGPKMGYTGPAAGLPAWVSQQAKFKPFKTEQEVIDVYRKLDAQLRTKLPAIFNLKPKSPLDLRLEPELSRATASDHYTPPAVDGSRPGVFWSVVNDPTQYGSTGMVTLFLHEGQPGHHFHIALVQELGLPNFRKFGGNNAFTEGWALYAETLGKDMGLFDKPEDYFGHLNDEMLRAARLVVDTGLHTKGWSREQAIKYFSDTLGYSELESRAQIERYMVWPGQALGYKIGSLKILELRHRAEAALGPKFDIRKFHDIVLGEGTLPLALLEKKVDRWIAASK